MLIVTHCKTPLLRLWDFEKGYLEAQYMLPGDVCQAQFIDPYPLLFVSDIKGSIFVFTTKHHIQGPFKLLAQWKNMFSIQKTSQLTFVECIYNSKTKETEIVLGD